MILYPFIIHFHKTFNKKTNDSMIYQLLNLGHHKSWDWMITKLAESKLTFENSLMEALCRTNIHLLSDWVWGKAGDKNRASQVTV